ncbi:MAG: pyridoxamine 5'-phosphate oxidase family protein [Bdellovibrionales bacterium]|nr:pyridoxamine 5'-phosphate oxidase family protein [Bdellovibrionales bacterium]
MQCGTDLANLVDRAKELLSKLEYINVATVSPAGLPWNTPVYARHDALLNFYWSSWKNAQHSLNLKTNENVFFTLYDSTRMRGDNNRRCLYFQGHAAEVEATSEIELVLPLLYPEEPAEQDAGKFVGDSLRRLYKARPIAVWLNDKSERQVTRETLKMRIEVPLDALVAPAC